MPVHPRVAVIGGGLAGLSTAAALGSAGYRVELHEARPFLGGRATSYPINSAGEAAGATIDNCQHVLLRCCTNLLDFYGRLGVAGKIRFYRDLYWIEPGGRTSVMKRGMLPAPLHFAGSFAKLKFLSLADKAAIASALLSLRYEYGKRADLDTITMLDWLREKKQTETAIERFWRQVLVSAINEELDRMAAIHGLQVFAVGFLSRAEAYEMGVPDVPLGDLYSDTAWANIPDVTIRERSSVTLPDIKADAVVIAVPFERLAATAPGLEVESSEFTHSPITGIHLWFDRPVTSLPHATLLDRTIQWMFNKEEGRHIQLVVSASRSLTEMPRAQVIELAMRELPEFLPAAASAELQHAHVVKEVRATFSAAPGLESRRPQSQTNIENVFLAGDWTRSGWPATMEGAVRSGYLAAEAVTRFFGNPQRFLLA